MAKQRFTPKSARAKSRAGPRPDKRTFEPGYAGPTLYGKGGAKRRNKMFKPGVRTGATGPESGRHG